MTHKQAAQFIVERLWMNNALTAAAASRSRLAADGEGSGEGQTQKGELDPKLKALCDRMFLQIFSVPSLQTWLADASVVPSGDDGKIKIQLDFMKLPKEVIPDLERLLSVDYFKNHRLVKYVKNGQARTGLEIEVSPKDLPGSAYDYAF